MTSSAGIDYLAEPSGPLQGTLSVPGDKSISHRAVIMGAVARGITRINGMLKSADTLATIDVFREMGVRIEENGAEMLVHGAGKYGLQPPDKPLYFGNSGTSVRLLAGILAGQPFSTTLTGDESLSRRPMKRIADPLRQMGVELECTEQGTLPVRIRAGNRLRGIAYDMPVASAQLKSCLLLAGLYAEGRTRVCEPAITRDHTERMLSAFGAKLSRENNCIEIVPGELQATSINVPADISSAAFFLVAASICPGSDLLLKNVGINPTRSAVIDILSKMGAEIRFERTQESGAEPVADIRVKHAPLQGIEIPPDLVPVAIDELPVIMVAAASARGDTVLTNAAELRVKESDRIEAMANGLSRLGIKVSTRKDGMTVTGGPLTGGEVDSFGDHRIAMAFAVAALNAKEPVRVKDTLNVNTSFPGFVDMASAVGMTIRTEPGHG